MEEVLKKKKKDGLGEITSLIGQKKNKWSLYPHNVVKGEAGVIGAKLFQKLFQ